MGAGSPRTLNIELWVTDNYMQQNNVTITLYLVGQSENAALGELEGEVKDRIFGEESINPSGNHETIHRRNA